MGNNILVGIGKYKIAQSPDTLMTLGLGSCVAVMLYDPIKKIGGLAHIMLPHLSEFPESANQFRFADVVIKQMYMDMVEKGAIKNKIIAKIAGGAHMFKTIKKEDYLKIGENNLIAAREELSKLKIDVVAEDSGGSNGRTVYFDLETGTVKIKTISYTKEI